MEFFVRVSFLGGLKNKLSLLSLKNKLPSRFVKASKLVYGIASIEVSTNKICVLGRSLGRGGLFFKPPKNLNIYPINSPLPQINLRYNGWSKKMVRIKP